MTDQFEKLVKIAVVIAAYFFGVLWLFWPLQTIWLVVFSVALTILVHTILHFDESHLVDESAEEAEEEGEGEEEEEMNSALSSSNSDENDTKITSSPIIITDSSICEKESEKDKTVALMRSQLLGLEPSSRRNEIISAYLFLRPYLEEIKPAIPLRILIKNLVLHFYGYEVAEKVAQKIRWVRTSPYSVEAERKLLDLLEEKSERLLSFIDQNSVLE